MNMFDSVLNDFDLEINIEKVIYLYIYLYIIN